MEKSEREECVTRLLDNINLHKAQRMSAQNQDPHATECPGRKFVGVHVRGEQIIRVSAAVITITPKNAG